MPPLAEFFDLHADHPPEESRAALVGGPWACALGTLLLSLLFLTVVARWLGPAGTRAETIVQQPVLPGTPTAASASRPEPTAPDPGDNLP